MQKLILKKQSKGYYYNQIDNINIVVSLHNNEWSGTITNENETNNEKYILFKCFDSNKKSVTNQLIKYLLNN